VILYTVVPDHLLTAGLQAPSPELVEVRHEGRTLYAQPLSGGRGRVVRLLSTNPSDYLESCWQPGAMVDLIGRG